MYFDAILMSTHDKPFSIKKKKITLNFPNLQLLDFSKGLKNELEVAVVQEPSVFEPLKVYCILSICDLSSFTAVNIFWFFLFNVISVKAELEVGITRSYIQFLIMFALNY